MAFCALRLRRALSLCSSMIKHQRSFSAIPAISASPALFSVTLCSQNACSDLSLSHFNHFQFQFRGFRSSTVSFSPPRYNDNNKDDEIGPDTILFEGCDYNHWLITMDFPKDPKPTPEEMVETYVQTLAKVVGSVEEAKKRMYACSTTTYTGFQAVMTEEMSEKFKGLPGVVFVLPDSYIDPVNKEYGGDKYINGTIIPRPPPVRYGGQGGRYGDQNRGFNRQPRGQYQQGQSTYDSQGSMQGNPRNYRAPQSSPPQQNYGPPQGSLPQHNYGPPQGSPPQHNYGLPQGSPPQQSYGPPQGSPPQQSYGPPQGSPPQQSYGPPQGSPPQQSYRPPQGSPPQQSYRPPQNYPPQQSYGPQQSSQPQQNYRPAGTGEIGGPLPINNAPEGRDPYQGERRAQMPSPQASYNHGERGNYYPQGQRDFPPGNHRNYMPTDQRDPHGDNRNFAPIQGGPYGQGADGTHVQGVGATHGRDMDAGYGQSYPGHGGHQSFPQMEQQNSMQGEQGSYATMGHIGMDQGKY